MLTVDTPQDPSWDGPATQRYLRQAGPERDRLDAVLASICGCRQASKFEPRWKREAAARKANTKARKNGGNKKRR